MTLKTKLTLGLAFLFLIIFSLVAVCSYYVGRLGAESAAILRDNYASIVYARNMFAGVDDMKTSAMRATEADRRAGMSDYYGRLFGVGKTTFETNLRAEQGNITEIHEKEAVDRLSQDYDSYVRLCEEVRRGRTGSASGFDSLQSATERLKHSINAIYDINMQAVVRKSKVVERDSSRFITSMAIIGSICIVFAFGYFWYFPVYISTTLSYLAERMKKLLKRAGITAELGTKDEAFVILHGIGLLENQIAQTSGSSGEPKG